MALKKNSYTLFVLLTVGYVNLFGQQLKPNSLIKAKHISYKTDSLMFGGMTVENENNTYKSEKPNEGRLINIEKSDKSTTSKAFKQVFSNQRLNQLKNEAIVIKYYLSDTGKILEVSFLLKQDDMITAQELEDLEMALKENVSFTIRGKDAKSGGFFVQFQVVRFSKILDGTFPG